MKQRGSTLIFLVLLLVGLFGLAAVVVDLGYVRLVRQRMSTACDGAALVGLQGRDVGDPAADLLRREAARDLASWSLADESQSPLALNLDNALEGDLVAGDWVDGEVRQPDENADYSRADFRPNPAGSAFLVRMRRTSETLRSEVGSAGARLPYHFAYGSLLAPEVRDAGVAARATAIAVARPAKAAGRALGEHGVPGVLPLALRRDLWNQFVPNDRPTTMAIRGSGGVEILVAENNAIDAGQVIDATGRSIARSFGELAPQIAVPDLPAWVATVTGKLPSNRVAFLPLVAAADAGLANRIVGFGYVESLEFDPNDPRLVTFVRRTQRIASANATAIPTRALDLMFTDDAPDADLRRLLDEHAMVDAPLLSAALRR